MKCSIEQEFDSIKNLSIKPLQLLYEKERSFMHKWKQLKLAFLQKYQAKVGNSSIPLRITSSQIFVKLFGPRTTYSSLVNKLQCLLENYEFILCQNHKKDSLLDMTSIRYNIRTIVLKFFFKLATSPLYSFIDVLQPRQKYSFQKMGSCQTNLL